MGSCRTRPLPGKLEEYWELPPNDHPDDRDNAARTITEYLAGTRPEYRNEFRLQHKDGSWRWIFTHGIADRDATDRAIRLLGTHRRVRLLRVSPPLNEFTPIPSYRPTGFGVRATLTIQFSTT